MNTYFKHRAHHISFKAALSGLFLALASEINMKIIVVAIFIVVTLGFLLHISQTEWLAVVISIVLVSLAEMVNTSIEAVCDLITREWHKDVKSAKDIAGGMVLVASVGSAVVGLIIFLPKILSVLNALPIGSR